MSHINNACRKSTDADSHIKELIEVCERSWFSPIKFAKANSLFIHEKKLVQMLPLAVELLLLLEETCATIHLGTLRSLYV